MNPGRNRPCPCGSGRKFKLCCLPKFEAQEQAGRVQEEAELDQWLRDDFELGQKLLAEYEFNRRFPHGATTGMIQELPDGSTLVEVVAKEA